MSEPWFEIDAYFEAALPDADPALANTLRANQKAGLPAIDVSPLHGRMLRLLVQIAGAKRVLEIGTLGGYSTIEFADAVGEGGEVVTLELLQAHAEIAASNLRAAGLLDRVDIRVGAALETLQALKGGEGARRFDFAFIDADKENNEAYLMACIDLVRVGGVIVIDNIARAGRVIDANDTEASVLGTRKVIAALKGLDAIDATLVQTVGTKGHDGFMLARVVS